MKKFRKSFEICLMTIMILLSTAVALMLATAENISNSKGTSYNIDFTNRLDSLDCSQICWKNASIQLINCSYSECGEIPKEIRNTTEQLIMRGNILEIITRKNLIKFRLLLYLDLSNCHIRSIESESFSQLVRLQVLDLSENPFCGKYPEHLFSPLSDLTQLFLTDTRQPHDFSLDIFQNLTNLEVLWFRSNRIFKFPGFLSRKNRPILPRLKELNLDDNYLEILNYASHEGLEVLETLILSGNRIQKAYPYVFESFKKLSRLVLDRNCLTPIANSFSSESLKDLSLNYITPIRNVSEDALNGIPNLEKLSLERSPVLFKTAFLNSKFPNLVMLNIRGTGVSSEVLENITANHRKLRYLDLNGNEIDILRDTMFNNLELEVLLLGSNRLKILDMTSLPFKTWSHLQRVDFSNNLLLECDCSIIFFRRWLNYHKKNATVDNLSETKCLARGGNNNYNILMYHLNEPTDKKCYSEESDFCLIAVFAIIVVICFLSSTTSMLYRFRWQIKYHYFLHMLHSRQTKEVVEHHQYLFDAFICYSDFNRSWVVNQLCPQLETGFHLRLCIRDRDWLAGQDIVDNVVDSIENSRKTVLIVSNAFAVSHWRHFEMTMAQTKLFKDDRDNLILVLLEEIADCNMNPKLQLQMEKKTYVEWTDNQFGQELFWAQLKQALAKSSGSLINSAPPKELFFSLTSEV